MEDGGQYMKYGMDSLNELVEILQRKRLKYRDNVIIGDNSSGKSLLLKMIIENYGVTNDVYFIDAVNRGFNTGMVIKEEKKPEYKQTIVNTRIKKEFFNLRDSFNCYGTLTERIEQIYFPYEKELQKLFEELTKERFQIIEGETLGEVSFKIIKFAFWAPATKSHECVVIINSILGNFVFKKGIIKKAYPGDKNSSNSSIITTGCSKFLLSTHFS